MKAGVQSIGLAMVFDEPNSWKQEAMAIAAFALRCWQNCKNTVEALSAEA
jgi:hypothetical protein